MFRHNLTLNHAPIGVFTLQDVVRKYPDVPPRLDPVEDMGIEDPVLLETVSKIEALEGQLAVNPGERS